MKMIKNAPSRPTLCGLVLALAAFVLSSFVAQAHPYASGITNTSGTISFILNEAADNVSIVFPQNSTTNNMGAKARGTWTFTLGAGTNSYLIYVTKVGSGVPALISPVPVLGGNTNLAFFGPRGVAVNLNPKGHNFGRIYVANASAGTFVGRRADKGLYVVNADYSDAVGYLNTGHPLLASFPIVSGTNGWWGAQSTYAPYKVWVGQDDTVYVGDSSGLPNSGSTGEPVWMIDPDLTTPIQMFTYGYAGTAGLGNGVNAGGCQSRPYVTGSLATSDLVLTCLMWNYVATGGSYQSVLRYNIGAGPINSSTVWAGTPDIIVTNSQWGFQTAPNGINGVTCDLIGNPTNSYVYVSYNRSLGGGFPAGGMQLAVYDASAASPVFTNHLWASSDPGYMVGTNDAFQAVGVQTYGMAISPDGQYLGFGNNAAASICIVKLTNGIPDVSTIAKYTAANSGQRGAAFDRADNFYTVDGNSDSLRCYSLGFTTTCVTSNDASAANGSFWMVLPPSTVSVTATTPNASQGSPTPVPGVFTLTRQGQLNAPLYVHYSFGGTASNSTYTVSGTGPNGTNITFAIGQSTTNVTITPVHDGVPRLTTSVVLSLAGGTNYSVTAPVAATVLIQNTAEPQLVLSAAASTCYKRYTNDYASVTITRLGDTNVALSLSTFTYGGTAVQNTDFEALSATTIPAGTVTTNARILRPLNPPEPVWVGNKTVVATLGNNGSTYSAGGSQTLTILDDKYPAAPVLWYEPLTNNIDVNNDDTYGKWNITAVNRDGTDPFAGGDMTINWGYDLVGDPSGYGLIPLPPNGFTAALRATYNKVHGVSGAVNLYPTNVTFSGDYAVRFHLYISQGSALAAGKITEGPMFGINHDGLETNWFARATPIVGGPWSSDGVWYWIDSDPGGDSQGDYRSFTGAANAIPNTGWASLTASPAPFGSVAFPNVFKHPEIFTGVGATTNDVSGLPANASYAVITPTNANWADVEIKQVKNSVTLSINKTVIFTYANTNSLFEQGTIMLGYEDPFDSLNAPDGAAYFSDVQVVRLSALTITSITTNGLGSVIIQFTAPDGNLALQSCGVVNGTYADVSPAATFTQNPVTEVFQTVYPQNGAAQYYRIRYQP